jgi:amino acid transporter
LSGAGVIAGRRPPAVAGAPGLVRGVGRWAMVGLMINAIIGAGIFGLPSRVHALAGPWALAAYVACAIVIGAIVLCFAEVASRFTGTGGPYLYTRAGLGPAAGFVVGWLAWIARATALAVIADVFASYLGFFWAPATAGAGRALVILVAMAVLSAINVIGVTRAAMVSSVLTAAKLVPLVAFIAVGVFFVDPGRFAGAPLPAPGPFSQALFQLVFAFGGFEAVVVAAGESRDPQRDIPFALVFAIGATTLIYVLIQIVCIGTLPGLATSVRPLADASVRFAGRIGGSVIAVGALISAAGTLLASLLAAPRVLFAMSEHGQMPRVLAAAHPRFRTPVTAILVTAVAALALALSGTFTRLLSLNVIARLLQYLGTAIALIVLRRRPSAPPARFPVRGGTWVAGFAILASLALLTRSGLRELRDIGLAVGAGFVLAGALRWRVRRSGTGPGGAARA